MPLSQYNQYKRKIDGVFMEALARRLTAIYHEREANGTPWCDICGGVVDAEVGIAPCELPDGSLGLACFRCVDEGR